jgi:hypothetical protein
MLVVRYSHRLYQLIAAIMAVIVCGDIKLRYCSFAEGVSLLINFIAYTSSIR